MWLPGFLGDSSNVVHSDASSVERRAGQRRQLASGCVSELNEQVLRTLRKVSYSIQTYLLFCSWWMNVVLNSVITVNSLWVEIVAEGTYIVLYSNLRYQDSASHLYQVMAHGALSFFLVFETCLCLFSCLPKKAKLKLILVTFTKRESACFV